MPAGWRNFVLDKGFDAGGAITRYRAVKLSAEGTVIQVTASTDATVGVAQEAVSAGEQARGKGVPVAVEGITIMEAGGAITLGSEVMADTSGRAVTAATATNRVIGRCIGSAPTGAGQHCVVQLDLPGRVL